MSIDSFWDKQIDISVFLKSLPSHVLISNQSLAGYNNFFLYR